MKHNILSCRGISSTMAVRAYCPFINFMAFQWFPFPSTMSLSHILFLHSTFQWLGKIMKSTWHTKYVWFRFWMWRGAQNRYIWLIYLLYLNRIPPLNHILRGCTKPISQYCKDPKNMNDIFILLKIQVIQAISKLYSYDSRLTNDLLFNAMYHEMYNTKNMRNLYLI